MFKLLKLNKQAGTVFESPMWSTWTKLNKENLDEAMFLVLKKQYGDDGLAKAVGKAAKSSSTKAIVSKLEERSIGTIFSTFSN